MLTKNTNKKFSSSPAHVFVPQGRRGLAMASQSLPEIPANLAEHAEKIHATAKDALRVKLTPAKDLPLWQSKVGGTPYMPVNADYPKGPAGDPLKLLAQINLSEIPRLPGYPESGILQFYLDPFDEFLGLGGEFDHTGQKRYRVLYFETVETDTSKLKTEDPLRVEGGKIVNAANAKASLEHNWPFQSGGQYSMEFEPFRQVITSDDYRTGSIVFDCNPNLPWHEQYATKPELFDAYEEAFKGSGHQFGGYPYFTQDDPRGANTNLRGYELLFQLDSQVFASGDEIIWGDMGVANFFIKPEDLEKRDFTKIMYNWDCS
ncbi:hypothetical protein GE061_005165 [Apolygus lucorum]|uniref:Uncharacterized protein n=1 Tax=Apolygus lucorum TaxID=248454 RepID=A0A6A4JHQ1_APOLU|nr:hypothetical protein GE061_005165 [Apolygus lucorum]